MIEDDYDTNYYFRKDFKIFLLGVSGVYEMDFIEEQVRLYD